jgi:hypothetical protein
MKPTLMLMISLLAVVAQMPLGMGHALAKGKHQCGQYGKANHCQAGYDKRSKMCSCLG